MFKQIAALLRRKPVEPEINYTINFSLPEVKKKPVAKKAIPSKSIAKKVVAKKTIAKKTITKKK